MLDTLRRHFGTYGPIYAWAPLKSFARIILVYYSEDDAEQAKDACDRLLVGPSEDRSVPCRPCYICLCADGYDMQPGGFA